MGHREITVPGQPEPVEIEVKWRYKDKPAFNTWFAAITGAATPTRLR